MCVEVIDAIDFWLVCSNAVTTAAHNSAAASAKQKPSIPLHSTCCRNAHVLLSHVGCRWSSKTESHFVSKAGEQVFGLFAVDTNPDWILHIESTAEETFQAVTACGKCCTVEQVRHAYALVREASAAIHYYVDETNDDLADAAVHELLSRGAQNTPAFFARCLQHALDAELHVASGTHVAVCKPAQRVPDAAAAGGRLPETMDIAEISACFEKFVAVSTHCEQSFENIDMLTDTQHLHHDAVLKELTLMSTRLCITAVEARLSAIEQKLIIANAAPQDAAVRTSVPAAALKPQAEAAVKN